MPYIDPETVKKIREVDLLTHLQTYEPKEFVHVSGNVYCTKTHDSLRISSGKWCWFSHGIRGKSELDHLIKVRGYSFMEAVNLIIRKAATQPPSFMFELWPISEAGALTRRFWTTVFRPGGFMRARTRAMEMWSL